jgi:hypothetical protein
MYRGNNIHRTAEILARKSQAARGMRKELYYFRDQQRSGGGPPHTASQHQTVAGRNQGRKDRSAFHGILLKRFAAGSAEAVGAVDRGPSKVPITSAYSSDRQGGGGSRRQPIRRGTCSSQMIW